MSPLSSSQGDAIVLLSVDRHMPHVAAAALMADVYADHKDEDNFLYITYRCGTGSCSAFRVGSCSCS